ncbi:MAG: arylsulfatase A-like enzyme [Saprospiraceae bacterium]|jgi:arylsulfatase A-like enzyme
MKKYVRNISVILKCAILLLIVCFSCTDKNNGDDYLKPNILFIAIDDLRPELGCYGNQIIKSPNIDQLASEGYLFENHYVTVPTCGPSRHCLLTGIAPKTRDEIKNSVSANTLSGQEEVELPETFLHQLRRNGYYTVGIGKISHHPDGHVYGYMESPENRPLELPHSWDEMLLNDEKWESGHNAFFGYANGTNRNTLNKEVKPYENADVPDTGYVDGLTTLLAINKLQELKLRNEPFCLAVGFFKPHLPFTAPKKYWDLYNRDDITVTESPNIPKSINEKSLQASGEFNQYKLGEEKASLSKPVSDEYAKKLKHAYYACISYIDAQVGMLLQELEDSGMAENTIVILWGDHGWHLGDHRVWGKHTLFDRALHSPLIIRTPHSTSPKNISEVVSTMDIYPTLMDLCDVDMPYASDGQSMMPLLESNDLEDWDNDAFSYFKQGISLKTPEYRITKYFRNEQPDVELYDHVLDPLESVNIAAEFPGIRDSLLVQLEKGNTGLFD